MTGLRRGEILALRWQHIDFDRQCVAVCEAWKGGKEMGPPKWDHLRVVPISSRTIHRLYRLRAESVRTTLGDYVFGYDDGSPIRETWWRKRFCICSMDRTFSGRLFLKRWKYSSSMNSGRGAFQVAESNGAPFGTS